MVQRYLLVWLILSSLIGFFWPRIGLAFDPFLPSKQVLTFFIQMVMLCIGMLMQREEIRDVFRRWPQVLGGTVAQYLILPFLGFVIAKLMQLDDAAYIGLVMVGCVPGAMASNVLTLQARGNVSYSVSLTICSTLMSPLMVPLGIHLFLGEKIEQDFVTVALDMVKTVAGPVLAGFALAQFFPALEKVAAKVAPLLAQVTILWIIAVVVARNRDALSNVTGTVLLALLLVNVLGYAGGYLVSFPLKLTDSMRRALTLEGGMQNAGLGSVLTLAYFPDLPAAAIPPAAYTFLCMLTGTMLAQYWRRVPPLEAVSAPPADSTPA